PLGEESPGTNMSIRWAADMTTQFVEGITTEEESMTPTIEDGQQNTLFTAEGTLTSNGTKGTPAQQADASGDWRETLILRSEDTRALRIDTSTEVADRKLHTLMHVPQYRVGVAQQQTAYNQPPHPSFYLASDIDWSRVEVPEIIHPE